MSRALSLSPSTSPSEARFAAFVAEHRPRALSLAWRLCDGDARLAEEVAQEAFALENGKDAAKAQQLLDSASPDEQCPE